LCKNNITARTYIKTIPKESELNLLETLSTGIKDRSTLLGCYFLAAVCTGLFSQLFSENDLTWPNDKRLLLDEVRRTLRYVFWQIDDAKGCLGLSNLVKHNISVNRNFNPIIIN
jgi:hypothetical protein